MPGLQQTYINNTLPGGRADLHREDFEKLIAEKGRNVIHERAMLCPCKGQTVNNLSTCRNCGGVGFFYINPQHARMVITGLDALTKYQGWSEELRGLAACTWSPDLEASYMDRITLIDGEAIHNEVVHFRNLNSTTFAYTSYNIKKVLVAFLFQTDTQKHKRLIEGTDFAFNGAIVTLADAYSSTPNLTLTITYKYAPTFHIIDMKRETMQSFAMVGGKEVNQNLPVSGYARRPHYFQTPVSLSGATLLDNSYSDSCASSTLQTNSYLIQVLGNLYDFGITQGDDFDYTINVMEGGLAIDISTRVYKMQVRDDQNTLITEFTIANGGIEIIAPNKVHLNKDSIDTLSIPPGIYNYNVKETIGSDSHIILSGNFIVAQQVTQ